jgi:hypothetical protein
MYLAFRRTGKWECPFQTCDTQMKQYDNLKYHINRHYGITPFKCPYNIVQQAPDDPGQTIEVKCPNAYPEPAALSRHKGRKHDWKPGSRASKRSMKAGREADQIRKQPSRLASKPELIARSMSIIPVKQEEAELELTVSLPWPSIQQASADLPLPSGQLALFPEQPLSSVPAPSTSAQSTQWLTSTDSSYAQYLPTMLPQYPSMTPFHLPTMSEHLQVVPQYLQTIPQHPSTARQDPLTMHWAQYAGHHQVQYSPYPTALGGSPGRVYSEPTSTFYTQALGGPPMHSAQTRYNAEPFLTGRFSGKTSSSSNLSGFLNQLDLSDGLFSVSSQASSSAGSPLSLASSLGPSPPSFLGVIPADAYFMPTICDQACDMASANGFASDQYNFGVNDDDLCNISPQQVPGVWN